MVFLHYATGMNVGRMAGTISVHIKQYHTNVIFMGSVAAPGFLEGQGTRWGIVIRPQSQGREAPPCTFTAARAQPRHRTGQPEPVPRPNAATAWDVSGMDTTLILLQYWYSAIKLKWPYNTNGKHGPIHEIHYIFNTWSISKSATVCYINISCHVCFQWAIIFNVAQYS